MGEGDYHQPPAPLGCGWREGGGGEGAGGGAEEMHLRLPVSARNRRYRGFEILDAAGDVGIVARAARVSVAVVVHGPHVVAVAREHVHERVLAPAGDGEIV